MNTTDARFDAALRACHAGALDRISPATRAQLVQRRRAALRGGRPHVSHGVRYAVAGLAAVSALVVGLQLRQPALPTVPVQAQAAAEPAVRPPTFLDEDPEFYAWLASSDARLVAME